MIDSGAFSVWRQGASINLREYLKFCRTYEDASYFINLDSMSGDPNRASTRIDKVKVERDCKESYDNFKVLASCLGIDKVLPVFHYEDHIKWLDKYLNMGATYVAVSPKTNNPVEVRKKWLRSIQTRFPSATGSSSSPVRVHGLGIASFDLMTLWNWYSVDSSSWKNTSSWGNMYLPQTRHGKFVYDISPFVVAVSPKSTNNRRQQHVDTMTPHVREYVNRFLEEIGVPLGESEIVKTKDKPDQKKGQLWYDRARKLIIQPIILGVSNSFEHRCRVCIRFLVRANKDLPIEHIYFAGNPLPYELEYQMGRRLLSYHYIRQNQYNHNVIQKHLMTMKRYSNAY